MAAAAPVTEMLSSEAEIMWFESDDLTAAPVRVDRCKRSTWSILTKLKEIIKDGKDVPGGAAAHLEIVVSAENPDSNYKLTIVSGTVANCISELIKHDISPQDVITEFQRMAEFMSVRSGLKGIIVTGVFDNASVGGFGFLTTCADIDDADIVALQSGAAAQADLFKESVKQKIRPGIAFPDDDKSKLILPSRFG